MTVSGDTTRIAAGVSVGSSVDACRRESGVGGTSPAAAPAAPNLSFVRGEGVWSVIGPAALPAVFRRQAGPAAARAGGVCDLVAAEPAAAARLAAV